MFNKLVDVLKEVFWIKTPRARKRPKGRTTVKKITKKTAKKKTVRRLKAPAKKIVTSTTKPSAKIPKPVDKPLKVKRPLIDPQLAQVGQITHYFERIKVCVVKITQGTILIGDRLTIVSGKTSFVQKVWSMQIESVDVKVAKKGQLIGLKVDKPVAVGDIVYK